MPAAVSPVERFRKAVAAACSPLSIGEADILVSGRAISIPAAGLHVSAELSGNGKRVWRAVSRMAVRSVSGEGERVLTEVLFEEPFEKEWQVARRIALHVAEARIDAAIDEAAV